MRGNREEVRKLLLDVIAQKISERAYELYEARGKQEGCELDDWLRAEDEIFGQSLSAPLYSQRRK